MSLVRAFHTVRYLKPVQVANRIARRLLPLRVLPQLEEGYWLTARLPVPPARIEDGGWDGKSFCLLNRRWPFEGQSRWSPRGAERLWHYQLHYFSYLWGVSPSDALTFVRDWIESNRDPRGPGWEAYPLSMRIREWIEWSLANPEVDAATRCAITASVAQQVAALEHQLEYHLLGNHLLENGITLCWAGLSLDGSLSGRWLRSGLRVLRSELPIQVLPDGSHDERSPMYQALLAEALLRLAEVASRSSRAESSEVHQLAGRAGSTMLHSLALLVHPDGGYALLNDCAQNLAPTLAVLRRRYPVHGEVRSDPRAWSLDHAGYFGALGQGEYLVFDAGPIAPDHQPAHGHADTFGFELSHHGRRVFTDTGVFTYTEGATRGYDRSTAAHNTLELDGQSQSELWAAFRCGRRPIIEEAGADPGGQAIFGRYRGAARCGVVRHGRRLERRESELRFRDEVEAAGRHQAKLFLHLAPGLDLRSTSAGWSVLEGSTELAAVVASSLCWNRAASPYHPEFGKETERACLVAAIDFVDRLSAGWTIRLL